VDADVFEAVTESETQAKNLEFETHAARKEAALLARHGFK
jgi:hypothetical protein